MTSAASSEVHVVRFGTRTLPGDRASVMAIVNRTPDSFYDRGATYSDHAAMTAVDRAVDEGADIVDIGGVKAGPGDEVGVAEETRRNSTEIRELRHEMNEMGKVLDRVLYELQRQKENEVPRFVPLSSFRLAGLRLCGNYRTPGTRTDFPSLTSRADAFSEE